ncbi:MAG: hypothetical protein AAB588_01340 [Patescibacteria group bacterium]
MQSLIDSTRLRLSPFLENTVSPHADAQFTPAPASSYANAPARAVRHIPTKNYDNLGKLVPISWL